MESSDLAYVNDRAERENATTRGCRKDLNNDLPTYFQTLSNLPLDDRKVELLTLDLSALPRNIDDLDFKKHLFPKDHVVKMETHKDNITGMGTGMGRVQIRISDDTQKGEIIHRLQQSGIHA